MKKLLVALFLVSLLVPVVKAEDAYFKFGDLELTVPIKGNLDIVSLYDIWNGEGLLGCETQVANYKKLNLNFGAVSSFLGKGTPYVSLDYDFGTTKPHLADIGIWMGRDFHLDEWRAGIKASTKLW